VAIQISDDFMALEVIGAVHILRVTRYPGRRVEQAGNLAMDLPSRIGSFPFS
jgi:hypothetical protein